MQTCVLHETCSSTLSTRSTIVNPRRVAFNIITTLKAICMASGLSGSLLCRATRALFSFILPHCAEYLSTGTAAVVVTAVRPWRIEV